MFFSFLHFFSHFHCIIKANMPEWGGMEQPRSGKVGTPLSRFGIKQFFFLFPPQNLLHKSAYVQLQAPVKMLKQIFCLFLSPKSTVHVSQHVNLCKALFGCIYWSLEFGIGIGAPQFRCLDGLGIAGWAFTPMPNGIPLHATPPPAMSCLPAPYWAEIALPTPASLSP